MLIVTYPNIHTKTGKLHMMTNEQKLVDICFQLTITTQTHRKYFKHYTTEEMVEWVAEQLKFTIN
jgi:hypothetical protein